MITIEQCKCSYPKCSDYWLVGIGKFTQGSGFTMEEAQRIANLINLNDEFKNPVGASLEEVPS